MNNTHSQDYHIQESASRRTQIIAYCMVTILSLLVVSIQIPFLSVDPNPSAGTGGFLIFVVGFCVSPLGIAALIISLVMASIDQIAPRRHLRFKVLLFSLFIATFLPLLITVLFAHKVYLRDIVELFILSCVIPLSVSLIAVCLVLKVRADAGLEES